MWYSRRVFKTRERDDMERKIAGRTVDEWWEDDRLTGDNGVLRAREKRRQERAKVREVVRARLKAETDRLTADEYARIDDEYAGAVRRAYDAGVPLGVLRDLVVGPSSWAEFRDRAGISRGGWD